MQVETIIELCEAYESGFNAARMNLSSDNNDYIKKTDNYYAWMLGHNVGIQAELFELDEGWIN